jgi:methylglutaconyl-CoA hydratase
MLKISKLAPSGTIALDFPATRNALSRTLVQSLLEALDDFHREKSVRAVILTHTGATFCSGADLKQWDTIAKEPEPYEEWQAMAGELHELIEVMLRFPKPIVCALDGQVIGIGLALVLASDLVVSSAKSRFSAPAAKLGLVSGLVAPLMSFRCGSSLSARLLLGLEEIDGVEAHRLGMVHQVVQSEQIWAKSHAIASDIALGAPESIQMTKRLLNEMIGESMMTHLSNGAAAMATACTTSAAIEGLAAFQEKRPPKFP